MIRYLSGNVLSVSDDQIHLDVAGFGLEIFSTEKLLQQASVGHALTCLAYLQVSEAGMSLFGFSDETERSLFLDLLQVKTMGGKLCIALLRHLSAEKIINAIIAQDTRALSVPGLGPKRAERICFEMKNKVEKNYRTLMDNEATPIHQKTTADLSVQEALIALGFSLQESQQALRFCNQQGHEENEEILLKTALSFLQKNRSHSL